EPKQATYWQLYDHTARAIKKVNTRLRVGGPTTAQAAWVYVFIEHGAGNNVPLDFVSTHVYGNDRSQDVFGTNEDIPRDKMVCRAVNKVHEQIKTSLMPNVPLIWSEFNASYKNEPSVTDSIYMGPWLADTIRQCDGLVDIRNAKAQQAQVWRLDSDHGDVHSAYEKMGAPRYPTQAELQHLRSTSVLMAPETRELKNGELTLDVPAHGLALVELK